LQPAKAHKKETEDSKEIKPPNRREKRKSCTLERGRATVLHCAVPKQEFSTQHAAGTQLAYPALCYELPYLLSNSAPDIPPLYFPSSCNTSQCCATPARTFLSPYSFQTQPVFHPGMPPYWQHPQWNATQTPFDNQNQYKGPASKENPFGTQC